MHVLLIRDESNHRRWVTAGGDDVRRDQRYDAGDGWEYMLSAREAGGHFSFTIHTWYRSIEKYTCVISQAKSSVLLLEAGVVEMANYTYSLNLQLASDVTQALAKRPDGTVFALLRIVQSMASFSFKSSGAPQNNFTDGTLEKRSAVHRRQKWACLNATYLLRATRDEHSRRIFSVAVIVQPGYNAQELAKHLSSLI